MTTEAREQQLQHRRDEWIARVYRLVNDIAQWAEGEGWPTHREQKRIHEKHLGDYQVPALRIRAPGGDVYVRPIALHVVGADGRVDLEAWPTLNRVKLVGRDAGWQIMTDSNVPLREPWGRESFLQLVRDLQA